MLLPAFLLILTTALSVSSQTTPADTAVLEQGKLVEREISAGEMHLYNLTIPAGGYAHVNVDQIGLNISVSIFVDGKKVRRLDNTTGGDREMFSLAAEGATTYRVEVLAPDKFAQKGKYTIVLKDSRPATETDKSRVEAEMAFEGAMELLYKQTKEARNEAIKKFEQSASFAQAAKDKSYEARAYYLMAHVYNLLGEFVKAEETATKALPIAAVSGNQSVHAYLFDTIGMSYDSRGLRKKALEFYQQALPLRTATDRAGRANTINNIGIVYAWMSERAKAREYLLEAAKMFGELGDRSKQATVFSTLCVIYNDMSEFNTALEYGNRGL